MQDPVELSLVQLASRHWKLGILCLCAGVGLAALATFGMPQLYEAEMKFLVNNERADLVITPEKNSNAQPPAEVTETQVNSEIELLKSRDLLGKTVAAARLNKPFETSGAAPKPTRLALARATRKLEKDLTISALRKTNIIAVTYRNSDPDLAVAVLGDLGERYLNSHLAAHSNPGSYTFFSDQVKKYGDELLSARLVISDFHQRTQLYSMNQQQETVLAAMQAVDARLKDTETELNTQRARLLATQRHLETAPERITTQVRTVPNQQTIQQLQAILTELRNRRINLAMKYQPTDRMVLDLDAQIANTAGDLAFVQSHSPQETTTDLDSIRQGMKAGYEQGQINIQALDAQRVQLARIRAGYLRQLSAMDTDFVTLQKLEESRKEAQDNYELYVHRLDEARLSDSLDKEKFSNVVMVERPVASPLPVSPKPSLNLAIGAVLGILAFLALAFYRETRHPQAVSHGFYPARDYQPASGD